MNEWQPIETAPRDGSVVLIYDPKGFEVDDHAYAWPEGTVLYMTPARWHTPNGRSHEESGWYPPHFQLDFGPYDDPSVDIEGIKLAPTHWMPLPEPPS